MRVDVKKCLIMGPMRQKSRFFVEMQQLGVVEFIGDRSLEMPVEIQNLTEALHILRQMVPVKQAADEDYLSARSLAAAAIEHNEQREQLREKRRLLETEIARVEPLGDFSAEQIQRLQRDTGFVFQVFCRKAGSSVSIPEEFIFLAQAYEMDYYLALTKHIIHPRGWIEIMLELSAGEFRHQLAEINRELDHLETRLSSLAYQKNLLKKGLSDALNHYHLKAAGHTTQGVLDQRLFSVEAWIPQNKLAEVKHHVDHLDLFLEEIAIEKEDRQPTYLENKGTARFGEDLVDVYDVPSSRDRDPSGWIFFAFGFFFSMIVADAGYGLLLLLAGLWLYKKYGKRPGLGRRIIQLTLCLAVGCLFWGTMLTSFFNIPISPHNPLRKVSLIHWAVERKADYVINHTETSAYKELVHSFPELENIKEPHAFVTTAVSETDGEKHYVVYDHFTDNVLIELSIFVGTIHIILSFLRYVDRHWAGIGWIFFLVGGYLYFPSLLHATSLIHYIFWIPQQGGAALGFIFLCGGIGLAALLSLIQNRWGGLGEVMHVIQVFADVMSYLRIYALSLAGMIMGATFDRMGSALPWYLGIFVFIVGHGVNLTLALMGGVIHGLRLNFIEWYHYSFEGGGRRFSPLALFKLD